MLRTISVLAENKPGTLMRVTNLVTARGVNIKTLTVAPTPDNEAIARITLGLETDEDRAHEIVRKMDRLINVLKVEIQ